MRVTQGKEPAHFVAMWQGEMRVYEGGVASGFRTVQEEDEAGDSDGATRLFQVRGVGSCPPYASQVPAAAASLNSGATAALLLDCMHAEVQLNWYAMVPVYTTPPVHACLQEHTESLTVCGFFCCELWLEGYVIPLA